MRSLGQFFGHIASGAKQQVEPDKERHVLRHESQEADAQAPDALGGGKVKLRRTTIEEIELERGRDGRAD